MFGIKVILNKFCFLFFVKKFKIMVKCKCGLEEDEVEGCFYGLFFILL